MNEQLEICISGRKFNISLNGFNPKASLEIRQLFENNNIDLLLVLREYLSVIHEKYELENELESIIDKIPNVG